MAKPQARITTNAGTRTKTLKAKVNFAALAADLERTEQPNLRRKLWTPDTNKFIMHYRELGYGMAAIARTLTKNGFPCSETAVKTQYEKLARGGGDK